MARRGDGEIGLVSAIAFAVGTMVGAGVFVLSGIAVKKAGPAAFVSFGVSGVLVLLSALSFAVVASLARAGRSGYAYVGTRKLRRSTHGKHSRYRRPRAEPAARDLAVRPAAGSPGRPPGTAATPDRPRGSR